MDVLAWILSGLLAAVFLAAGAMKLATPHDKLKANPNMTWAEDFSPTQVKAIGGLEVLGAAGVVLPWLLDIAPVLSAVAAGGLALVMVGALATHRRRGELAKTAPMNAVLLMLGLAVAALRLSQL